MKHKPHICPNNATLLATLCNSSLLSASLSMLVFFLFKYKKYTGGALKLFSFIWWYASKNV